MPPKARSPLTRAKLAGLKTGYEAGHAYDTLLKDFHLGRARLDRLAEKGGWIRPARAAAPPSAGPAPPARLPAARLPPTRRPPSARLPGRPATRSPARPPRTPAKLVKRLRLLVEKLIAAIEAQPLEAVDDPERWGKALTTIAKCAQAVDDLARAAPPTPRAAPAAPAPKRSLDELRETLDRRLDQLAAAHAQNTLSEHAD